MDFIAERVLFPALIALTVVAVAGVGIAIYFEASADKFSLRKDEWACTSSHVEKGLLPAGKVLVPTTRDVCDQWSRVE